ncbi:hypothetical protein [Nostoc sp.]|uniref:hypothetical protein n=1 Tax=Nostoc sp. TaxID=1180 RepID=UPI002FFCA1D7
MPQATTETQRSQCALLPRGDAKGDAVPRLLPLRGSKLRAASPLGEATGATRGNESLRGFLRKSYNASVTGATFTGADLERVIGLRR